MTISIVTPDMDKRIAELRAEGVKNATIARLVGCGPDLVRRRVAALQLPKRGKGRGKSMTSTEKL